jgi:voltage-gated potassium channel Kch
MLINIGIGVILLILTTAVHASAMVVVFDGLRRTHPDRWGRRSGVTRLALISAVVLSMFVATLIETGLWALTYLQIGALPSYAEALYFAMVTFTTLGYGDITLDEQWRLLSSFSAANGIMMFGWTTALIVAVVQRVYANESKPSS